SRAMRQAAPPGLRCRTLNAWRYPGRAGHRACARGRSARAHRHTQRRGSPHAHRRWAARAAPRYGRRARCREHASARAAAGAPAREAVRARGYVNSWRLRCQFAPAERYYAEHDGRAEQMLAHGPSDVGSRQLEVTAKIRRRVVGLTGVEQVCVQLVRTATEAADVLERVDEPALDAVARALELAIADLVRHRLELRAYFRLDL